MMLTVTARAPTFALASRAADARAPRNTRIAARSPPTLASRAPARIVLARASASDADADADASNNWTRRLASGVAAVAAAAAVSLSPPVRSPRTSSTLARWSPVSVC